MEKIRRLKAAPRHNNTKITYEAVSRKAGNNKTKVVPVDEELGIYSKVATINNKKETVSMLFSEEWSKPAIKSYMAGDQSGWQPVYTISPEVHSLWNSTEAIDQVVNNYKSREERAPIAKDHELGVSYGWVSDVKRENSTLYAKMALNQRGYELVASGAYRYKSSHFGIPYDVVPADYEGDGSDLLQYSELIEVSLTNYPRIRNLGEFVANSNYAISSISSNNSILKNSQGGAMTNSTNEPENNELQAQFSQLKADYERVKQENDTFKALNDEAIARLQRLETQFSRQLRERDIQDLLSKGALTPALIEQSGGSEKFYDLLSTFSDDQYNLFLAAVKTDEVKYSPADTVTPPEEVKDVSTGGDERYAMVQSYYEKHKDRLPSFRDAAQELIHKGVLK